MCARVLCDRGVRCMLYDASYGHDKIRYVECCCTLLLLMVYVKITLRVQIFSAISLAYIYIHIREASGRYLIMISIPLLNHAFPMHIAYYAHRTAYSWHRESISTRCTLNFSSCQAHRCRRRGPGRYTVPWPQTAACFANEPSKLPAK